MEETRAAIVALHWNVLGAMFLSDGGMEVAFRGLGREPMLLIDVFEEPKSAKIVDGTLNEVRLAPLSSFSTGQAIELAVILRQHHAVAGSRGSSGYPAQYYREMKRQGGF
ncbi:MAG: hypothetical protein HOP29_08500 [Phycisphaerales bacterium]|nr:hypothetical protein [Phycisphaerales bacterium]